MPHLVHAIGHVKVNTTVTEAVVQDATEILGLHVTYSDERQTWLSSNGRAAELVLLRSNENSAHRSDSRRSPSKPSVRSRRGSRARVAGFFRVNPASTAWPPA